MGVRSSVFKADKDLASREFWCIFLSALYFFYFEAKTLIRPFFNILYLGPVTYSARTQSESLQMSADFIFEKNVPFGSR